MRSIITAGAIACAAALSREDAAEVLRAHVSSIEQTGSAASLCTQNVCCTVSSGEACSISSMPKDTSTLVLPGGETRCIYSTSTPFAFQVIPGAADKVLLYYQGGGACWDQTSTNDGFCTSNASPQSLIGVFDRTNPSNAFRDYTIVHVLYCSGDIHGGDVVRDYTDSSGVPVTQKGFANAEATLDWLVKQQTSGALAAKLSNLVVMGCSAGSIGAQLWGNQASMRLKWNQV
jgi:hypothetical protein